MAQEVIKAAYRALAKKYHPDSYKGSIFDRDQNMKLINEAYDTLSDEQKKKSYDLKLQSQKQYTKKAEYNNEKMQSKDSVFGDMDSATLENEEKKDGRLKKIVKDVGKEKQKPVTLVKPKSSHWLNSSGK